MDKVVNVLIDDRPVKTKFGYTIMQSCAQMNVDLPKFCYHDKLVIAGNCRICLVEVVGSKKLLASCAVHVSENLIIYTNSSRVRVARQNVLEFLLANHPLDCPICDQGGECDLQDITAVFGADRGRFYEHEKRAVLNKDLGPLIRTSMNRCIHCTRCVRFISFSAGASFLGTLGRGTSTEIGTYVDQFLFDELSGNITDLCPVGALTSKPYSFKVRPWELVSIESVDIFDSLNSNILVDVAANRVHRVLPYSQDTWNEGWISNKARYAYDGLFIQRLTSCLLKVSTLFFVFKKDAADFMFAQPVSLKKRNIDFFIKFSWADAFSIFFSRLLTEMPKISNLNVLLGSLSDFETILYTKTFFNFLGVDNFYGYASNFSYLADFDFLYLFNSSLLVLARWPSFCLLVGTNPRFEAPVLNLRLTQLFNEYAIPLYRVGGSVNFSSYKVKLLSNSLVTLFRICEFQHGFCKNFYLRSFLGYPCVLVGTSVVQRFNSYLYISAVRAFMGRIFFWGALSSTPDTFMIKELNFFDGSNFISVLNIYSTWVQMLDAGLFVNLRNYTLYKNSFLAKIKFEVSNVFINYFIGFDSHALMQFLASVGGRVVRGGKLWNVYQGSHGIGVASFADLIFPSFTPFEKQTSFKTMFGLLQRSNIAINYNFGAKSDSDIFKSMAAFLGKFFFQNFFKFETVGGLKYNFSLTACTAALVVNGKQTGYTKLTSGRGSYAIFELVKLWRDLCFYNRLFAGSFFVSNLLFFKFWSNHSLSRITPGTVFNAPTSSTLINYYGDRSNTILIASKTLNLCSSIYLKKNFSFTYF